MKQYRTLLICGALFLLALFCAPILDLLLQYLFSTFGIYAAVLLGYLYSFSFTSGAASVMLAEVNDTFLLFALLATLGSTLADWTILKVLKTNVGNEIQHLLTTFKKLVHVTEFKIPRTVRLVVGFIIIGSPLPDEFGLFLMRREKRLTGLRFFVPCFVANFLCIYCISRFL
jgi:hypothetical protein